MSTLKELFGRKPEVTFNRDTFRDRLSDLVDTARCNRISARDIADLLEQKADALRLSHAIQAPVI
jgi:hypothetical protein